MKKRTCDDDNAECAIYGYKRSEKAVLAGCLVEEDDKDICNSITDHYKSEETACYKCSDKDLCNSYMPVDEIFKKQKKTD